MMKYDAHCCADVGLMRLLFAVRWLSGIGVPAAIFFQGAEPSLPEKYFDSAQKMLI